MNNLIEGREKYDFADFRFPAFTVVQMGQEYFHAKDYQRSLM